MEPSCLDLSFIGCCFISKTLTKNWEDVFSLGLFFPQICINDLKVSSHNLFSSDFPREETVDMMNLISTSIHALRCWRQSFVPPWLHKVLSSLDMQRADTQSLFIIHIRLIGSRIYSWHGQRPRNKSLCWNIGTDCWPVAVMRPHLYKHLSNSFSVQTLSCRLITHIAHVVKIANFYRTADSWKMFKKVLTGIA